MVITLEVPDQYLTEQRPDELGRRLKLNAALQMFRAGELSAGAAAELAEIDRFTFAEECSRRGIALIDYPASDLESELVGPRGKH